MCTHHLLQPVPNRAVATWEGYRSERFVLEGRDCILVQPDIPMPSNPWIWRTEFFGAFPALDLALLKAGFRVAYIDVQNMYGAPIAMRYMDRFYARMVETFGLLPQCVLEGFSRGALYALNWAALNPRSVACLYLDAPVCDFKSWPADTGPVQIPCPMFARRQSKWTRQPGPKSLFVSLSPTTSIAKGALLSGAACGAVRDACMASIVRPATQDRLFNTGASWASCAGAIVFYTAYAVSAVNQLGGPA